MPRNLCLRLGDEIVPYVERTAQRLRKSQQEVCRLLLTREAIWAETGLAPSGCFFTAPEEEKSECTECGELRVCKNYVASSSSCICKQCHTSAMTYAQVHCAEVMEEPCDTCKQRFCYCEEKL